MHVKKEVKYSICLSNPGGKLCVVFGMMHAFGVVMAVEDITTVVDES